MDAKTLITILAAISGIVLDWVGGSRAFKQDIAQDAGNGAALKTDVEYIKRGVDDMRLEQRTQGLRFDVLSERVTRIKSRPNRFTNGWTGLRKTEGVTRNDMTSNDTLALATLVAAYLRVAKGLGLKVKWVNLTAIGIAAVFALAPDAVRQKIIEISGVGLLVHTSWQRKRRASNADIRASKGQVRKALGWSASGCGCGYGCAY